jgi:SH3-like domain-containing protein
MVESMIRHGFCAAAAAAFLVAATSLSAAQTAPTGLPLPRFVSIKSDNVNVRRGPGLEYDLAFTYVRAGVPVEITQEFDTWRKIRDVDGSEGWVFHSLLSGERTALVAPWVESEPLAARRRADGDAAVVFYIEPRALVQVETCASGWCRIAAETHVGWIEQERLWGVYPGERF